MIRPKYDLRMELVFGGVRPRVSGYVLALKLVEATGEAHTQHMKKMLRKVADVMNRLVADRPPSKTYSANYIPNSNGEGGKVISTNSGMN